MWNLFTISKKLRAVRWDNTPQGALPGLQTPVSLALHQLGIWGILCHFIIDHKPDTVSLRQTIKETAITHRGVHPSSYVLCSAFTLTEGQPVSRFLKTTQFHNSFISTVTWLCSKQLNNHKMGTGSLNWKQTVCKSTDEWFVPGLKTCADTACSSLCRSPAHTDTHRWQFNIPEDMAENNKSSFQFFHFTVCSLMRGNLFCVQSSFRCKLYDWLYYCYKTFQLIYDQNLTSLQCRVVFFIYCVMFIFMEQLCFWCLNKFLVHQYSFIQFV